MKQIVRLSVFLFSLCVMGLPGAYADEKVQTEKDGFKWIEVHKDGKYGAKDMLGNTIVPAEYDMVLYEHNERDVVGWFYVYNEVWKKFEKNPKGAYSVTGDEIIPIGRNYNGVQLWSNYFLVNRKGKRGICDLTGKEIIPPVHKSIPHYDKTEGFYVYKRGKDQLLNVFLDENLIDRSRKAYEDAVRASKDSYALRDINETTITQPSGYSYFELRRELEDWVGIKNQAGEIVIPLDKHYRDVEYMDLGDGFGCYQVVDENFKHGIVALDGTIIIQPSFKHIRYKHEEIIDGYFETSGEFNSKVKGYAKGICWLDGKEHMKPRSFYKIDFHPVENHVGWFEAYDFDGKRWAIESEERGGVIVGPTKHYISYDSSRGFSVNGKYVGIFLTESGRSDDSQKQQWDSEKKERRAAIWGAVALGVAQAGVMVTGAIVQAEATNRQNKAKPSSSSETSAGNRFKDQDTFTKLRNGEYNFDYNVQFDKNGNAMYSNPGAAQFTVDLASETANIANSAYANNPGSSIMKSYAIRSQYDLQRAQREAQYLSTPHYFSEIDPKEIAAENERMRQERREYYASEREQTLNNAKNLNNAMILHQTCGSTDSSTGITSQRSSINSAYSGSTSYSTAISNNNRGVSLNHTTNKNSTDSRKPMNTDEVKSEKDNKLDAHQQYKSENLNVKSSDYTYKRKVTLYRLDGGKFVVSKQNVELYEKGANEYIKIDNSFFPAHAPHKVTAFRRRIICGGVGMYFD